MVTPAHAGAMPPRACWEAARGELGLSPLYQIRGSLLGEVLLELLLAVHELPILVLGEVLLLRVVLERLLHVAQVLLLVDLDDVAEGILDLLRRGVAVLLLAVLADALALAAQPARLHDPLLLRHGVGDLAVMRDDDHAAL